MEEISINSRYELEAWLQGKPVEWARAIAHRSAMRVLPLAAEEWKTDRPPKQKQDLTLVVFRANLILRAAGTWPARDMRRFLYAAYAAADAAYAAADAADAADAAADAADAAAYAAYAYADAADAAYAAADADAAAAYAGAAASAADAAAAAADAAAAVWKAVSQDAAWLAAQADAEAAQQSLALIGEPLWHGAVPEWAQRAAVYMSDHFLFVSSGENEREDWDLWYTAVSGIDGSPPRNYFSPELELKIATQTDEWWGRGAAAVNADIARWVEEERPPLSEADVASEVAQTPGALTFEGGDDGPIRLRPHGSVLEWDTGRGAAKRHEELLYHIATALDLCNRSQSPNNGVGQVARDLTRLKDALGDRVAALDPDFLIPRGDKLRRLHAMHEQNPDSVDLAPIPDQVRLELGSVVGAYNLLVELDPALAARDRALLGPDAKQNLVSPEQGQAKVDAAVEAGVVDPQAKEALDEEAEVAPAKPDPENRGSRRYSESLKNLLRRIVAVGWKAGVGLVSFGLVSISTAKWILANQNWLLQQFADNPQMLKILHQVIEALSKLPLA